VAKLVIIEGAGLGTEHDLGPAATKSFTSGRDPEVEIPIADAAISRKHFRIEGSPRGWRVIDLGSRNQTYLNGVPVREEALREGDILRVGDTELRFEDSGREVQGEGPASTIIKELPVSAVEAAIERISALDRSGDARPLSDAWKAIDLCRRLASTDAPVDLSASLLREIVGALAADRAAVLLREDTGWKVRASWPAGPDASGEPFRVSTSIVARAAGEKKAVLSRDTHGDERFRARESVITGEISSAMAAPLSLRDGSEGVLYADRRGLGAPYAEEELELLLAAAAPVSAILGRAQEEDALRNENRNLIRSIAQTKRIIGKSAAMGKVLDFIRRAAPTSMTVLISGETGTGKELVASAVHYASPRRGQPFVAINCAALPENLIESELFGHERGAFTGAVTRKKGRFELAEKGTVLLDEVGELSLPCQAKLLRLLEEREFERVGGVEPIKVDVRVIAATNRNLLDAVAAGNFREDLFYRLGVLQVELPSLRERPEDILLIAGHFLAEASSGLKKLGKAAEKKLLEYRWPGNVRQLRNAIESAVVLGEDSEIRPEDLLLPDPRARGAKEGAAAPEKTWEPRSLAEMERRHIEQVLEHTGGNKKKAAEILGIERCTLYAKLKNYGM